MNRRDFMKVSGLSLLSAGIFSRTEKESPYLSEDDPSKFYDTHITHPTFNDQRIISSNKDPLIAIKEARAKGFQNPVSIYIPDPNTPCITSVFS